MKNFVFTSLQKNAGKTSVIVGISKVSNKKIGYIKPFGDRLMYQKKRLWDHDASVVSKLLEIKEPVEEMTIGFDHSKLRYLYDEKSSREKLIEVVKRNSNGKEYLFVESGEDICHGTSVQLDALSVCKAIDGKLIVVVSGEDEDEILDDITFFKQNIDIDGVHFGGVIINKLRNIKEFKNIHLDYLNQLDVNVLGLLPYQSELTHPTLKLISEVLSAKVIAGEDALDSIVQETFVGAMSADAVLRVEKFKKKDKLIITSGDRSDMILASIDTECRGLILTNNILPPANIIARASEKNVPILLVKTDTYQTARRINEIVPLLTGSETKKIKLLKKLVQDHVNLDKLLE